MSKPNFEAKKERHRKLYEGRYHSLIGRLWFNIKRALKFVWFTVKPSRKRLSHFAHPLDHMPAPKRLYTQVSIWSIGLLVLTSVNVTNATFHGGEGVDVEYLALEISAGYITDEEGFLIKSMPLEGEATYDLNRIEMVEHEVQPNETLSLIAYRYGLNVSSVRYSNPALGNSDYLKIGQKLQIPPKNGIYVDIDGGDSLVKIVEEYKGNLDETKAFNALEDEEGLTEGEELFIVEGRPQAVAVAIANTPTYSAPASSGPPAVTQYDIAPSAEGWIRPTQGGITQGYRGGHYAYDVADRSRPPILAAASGTVIKASSGTWGGGYGNHIIIDHGNGYQTLYAHAEVLYVNNGDYVNQGQVIAKMGNTGRVYGATGIHLHFEISYNGRKLSPSIMGVW
jgi:murein DD-endopeptidase MepM/ murein hydrolase activator NlpD